MFIELPGKVVDDLIIGIEAMPGNAASGSQLGKSTDKDDRHAGIGGSAASAQGGISRRTQAD